MSSFRDKFEERLDSIEDLPTLPPIVGELQTALDNPKTSAEDIAAIIQDDPAITGKILRLANSAYFVGAGGAVASVSQAVARVGFREVGDACTALAVVGAFLDLGPHLDHKKFWRHAVLTGMAAQRIYALRGGTVAFEEDAVHVAGLLHDLGCLVLDQYFPEVFRALLGALKETDVPLDEFERRALGMDHGEIGGCLLERWRLPAVVVDAVRWHHRPAQAGPESVSLASMVHLASHFAVRLGAHNGLGEPGAPASADALDDLELSAPEVKRLTLEVLEAAKRCEVLLALG